MKKPRASSKLTTVGPGPGAYDPSMPDITVSIVEDDGQTRLILAEWINKAQGLRCVSGRISDFSTLPWA